MPYRIRFGIKKYSVLVFIPILLLSLFLVDSYRTKESLRLQEHQEFANRLTTNITTYITAVLEDAPRAGVIAINARNEIDIGLVILEDIPDTESYQMSLIELSDQFKKSDHQLENILPLWSSVSQMAEERNNTVRRIRYFGEN